MAAYFIALIAEVPFMVLSFYKSPGAKALSGIDVAFIVGLAVAAVAYLIFARSLDLVAESAIVRHSDEELSRGVNPELPAYRA